MISFGLIEQAFRCEGPAHHDAGLECFIHELSELLADELISLVAFFSVLYNLLEMLA
jgi:hypothetical protein